MTILIAIEGVLKSGPKMVREGRALVEAFQKAERRIVYLSDDSVERAEHWLAKNGIFGHAGVLSPAVSVDDAEPLRQRQISVARTMGHVAMVVDGDPETIKYCLENRITGLLFANPESTHPGWWPDRSISAWSEITERLDRKKAKEAASHE